MASLSGERLPKSSFDCLLERPKTTSSRCDWPCDQVSIAFSICSYAPCRLLSTKLVDTCVKESLNHWKQFVLSPQLLSPNPTLGESSLTMRLISFSLSSGMSVNRCVLYLHVLQWFFMSYFTQKTVEPPCMHYYCKCENVRLRVKEKQFSGIQIEPFGCLIRSVQSYQDCTRPSHYFPSVTIAETSFALSFRAFQAKLSSSLQTLSNSLLV